MPLSIPTRFVDVRWPDVPDGPGVYVVYDQNEVIYVGMAGRNGKGSRRRRLRDHSTGQVVNMFAQYLFLARVQFTIEDRITHPRAAKAACESYIRNRCSFSNQETSDGGEARELESLLKSEMKPTLNQ